MNHHDTRRWERISLELSHTWPGQFLLRFEAADGAAMMVGVGGGDLAAVGGLIPGGPLLTGRQLYVIRCLLLAATEGGTLGPPPSRPGVTEPVPLPGLTAGDLIGRAVDYAGTATPKVTEGEIERGPGGDLQGRPEGHRERRPWGCSRERPGSGGPERP